MPFTPPDADTAAAALQAATAHLPDVEMSQGRAADGSEWLSVTWPARQVKLHRDAVGTWCAFETGQNEPTGTGATQVEALREALAHG